MVPMAPGPETDEDGVMDLMDLQIPADEEEAIRKTLEEKTKYKEVAPTWELNMETYGYGKRRKVYDPDYEHVENAKFREYERLEADGYDETLKDADHDKPRNISAPGLAFDPKRREGDENKKYTASDYIVAPKVPQLQMGPGIGPIRPRRNNGKSINFKHTVLYLIGRFPRFSDSHISGLRPQDLECNFGLSWFSENGKM